MTVMLFLISEHLQQVEGLVFSSDLLTLAYVTAVMIDMGITSGLRK